MVMIGRVSAVCGGGGGGGVYAGGAKFGGLRGREREHLVIDETGEFSGGFGTWPGGGGRSAIKGPYWVVLEDVEPVLEGDFLGGHG